MNHQNYFIQLDYHSHLKEFDTEHHAQATAQGIYNFQLCKKH